MGAEHECYDGEEEDSDGGDAGIDQEVETVGPWEGMEEIPIWEVEEIGLRRCDLRLLVSINRASQESAG